MKPEILAARRERVRRANILLQTIAGCGRKFFRHGDEISRFVLAADGRVWFVDKYSQMSLPTFRPRTKRWERYFTEGDTLCGLVLVIAKMYILYGQKIAPPYLGERGVHWAYGDDIAKVRESAWALGIWKNATREDAAEVAS